MPHIPVIVQPNAGLPRLENGMTLFDTDADEFAIYGKRMVEMGVRIIGGCCGTTPEYIKKLIEGVRSVRPNDFIANSHRDTAVSSPSNTITFGDGIKIIGGRINPSTDRSIEKALLEEDYDEIISEAIEQRMAGVDIIAINVGMEKSEIHKPDILSKAVKELQGMVNTPLMIDSPDPDAIEAAVRIYNGKPLIKGVNGERESMESIFPIAKKYGAWCHRANRSRGGCTTGVQMRDWR